MKNFLLFLILLLPESCGGTPVVSRSVEQAHGCEMLGKRVTQERVRVRLYGKLGARVRTKSCTGTEPILVFLKNINQGDYNRLETTADSKSSPVYFDALVNGYIVEDSNGTYYFIATGLSDISGIH